MLYFFLGSMGERLVMRTTLCTLLCQTYITTIPMGQFKYILNSKLRLIKTFERSSFYKSK